VVFLWRDAGGIIVGRSQIFVPSTSDTYSLEVQPRVGGLCPTNQKSFDATAITEDLEVALDIVPFCADQISTTIAVDADLSQVQNIEWYRVQGGTRTRIPQFDDLPIIEVSQEVSEIRALEGNQKRSSSEDVCIRKEFIWLNSNLK
jgi:hypothetical protein